MKQKSLMVLSGVTVAAIAAAFVASRGDQSSASASVRGPLFPDLKAHVNDVARVKVEKAGKSVTLQRDGNAWELADRGGYPAKFEEVKELVMRVAGLEIQEKLTARKENHAKLAVEWPTTAAEGSEAGEAALVTLEDASGKSLASVVVGKTEWKNSKPKVYVRRANEDQVWLCEPPGTGALDVLPEPKSWLDAKFIEVANDRVQSVTIEHADGEKVEIARSPTNHTQFAVQNVPPGRQERYDGIASGPAQALSYVQLTDVRPVGEVDFTQAPVAKSRFRTTDGLEILVETCTFEEQPWVKLVASYTPPPEPAAAAEPTDAAPTDGATPAEGTEGAPPTDAPVTPETEKKDIAAEAAELNQRLAPWAFQVDSYKKDVIARRMNDLLAELDTSDDSDSLEGMMEELGLPPTGDKPPPVDPDGAPADEGGDPEPRDDAEGADTDHPAPPPDEGSPDPK